jgi:hypothetical protein
VVAVARAPLLAQGAAQNGSGPQVPPGQAPLAHSSERPHAALSALRALQARVAKISQSLSAQVRVQAGRPGVEVAG